MQNNDIKPRSIRTSTETVKKLRILCALTNKTQNQVLNALLTEETQHYVKAEQLVTQLHNQPIKRLRD